MATIKSFTSLEQSKKLAEILPIESADMFWLVLGNTPRVHVLTEPLSNYSSWENYPCWSVSALLSVLTFPVLRYDIEDGEGGWIVSCENNDKIHLSYYRDNPVDTCYEMILKLHELDLV